MCAPLAPCRFWFRCAVWACVLGFGFRLRSASPPGMLGCVCARAPVPRGLLHLLVGVAVRGCVFVRTFCLFPAFLSWGAVCGRACWAGVSAVPRPSWLGCQGVFFALFFCVSWLGFVVLVAGCPCPKPCGPCPPFPFLSGWAAGSFFFPAWCASACFGVPFPGGPLFLAWCCWFWLGCPPVPLWGSCLRCLLGGGLGRLLWCWRAAWWLWGVLLPPPLPPCFFFWGGGACSCLCLPWACARTDPHSVWSSGLLLAVVFCLAVFRPHGSGGLCTRWARRPFLPGEVLALPARRLRQAAACASWLGGWGCPCSFSSAVPVLTFWVVRNRCCRAHGGPVCGLPCLCAACWCGVFQGVRWLVSVSPSGYGQSCCVVPLCAVSRRVVLWRDALWRAVVRCAVVSRCAPVGQWRSAWPVCWCGVRAGVWLAGGWGVRLGVGVSLGPCCGGLGLSLGLVGRVFVRGVALPGGLWLGPVSSGGPGP